MESFVIPTFNGLMNASTEELNAGWFMFLSAFGLLTESAEFGHIDEQTLYDYLRRVAAEAIPEVGSWEVSWEEANGTTSTEE